MFLKRSRVKRIRSVDDRENKGHPYTYTFELGYNDHGYSEITELTNIL